MSMSAPRAWRRAGHAGCLFWSESDPLAQNGPIGLASPQQREDNNPQQNSDARSLNSVNGMFTNAAHTARMADNNINIFCDSPPTIHVVGGNVHIVDQSGGVDLRRVMTREHFVRYIEAGIELIESWANDNNVVAINRSTTPGKQG